MAKILTTKGLAAELEDIIRTSKDEVYLISYSFRISDLFLKRIRQAVEDGVKVNIVYGKFVYDHTLQSLLNIPNLSVHYCKDLHAKIYCNADKCILGSMNFSESSELQNIELGVLLTKGDDESAFCDALKHCKEIYKEAASFPHKNDSQNKVIQKKGFCIRTRTPVPLDHERPFSTVAYYEWIKVNDPYTREKYDHFTGEETHGFSSKKYPILNKNWDKYLRAMSGETEPVQQVL